MTTAAVVPFPRDASTRYAAATRGLAFHLWVLRYGSNATKTAETLAADPEAEAPTRQSIDHWVEADRWHERADDELRAIAPDLLSRDVQELALTRGTAVTWLRDAVEGRIPAQEITAPTVNLAFGAVNRTGISEREPATIEASAPARLTRDELCAMTLEQMQNAWSSGAPAGDGLGPRQPLHHNQVKYYQRPEQRPGPGGGQLPIGGNRYGQSHQQQRQGQGSEVRTRPSSGPPPGQLLDRHPVHHRLLWIAKPSCQVLVARSSLAGSHRAQTHPSAPPPSGHPRRPGRTGPAAPPA